MAKWKRPTQAQLEAAFKLVQNPEDWKDKINKKVTFKTAAEATRMMPIIAIAVEHFTSTEALINATPNSGRKTLHVRAPGYRAGPAGCH